MSSDRWSVKCCPVTARLSKLDDAPQFILSLLHLCHQNSRCDQDHRPQRLRFVIKFVFYSFFPMSCSKDIVQRCVILVLQTLIPTKHFLTDKHTCDPIASAVVSVLIPNPYPISSALFIHLSVEAHEPGEAISIRRLCGARK